MSIYTTNLDFRVIHKFRSGRNFGLPGVIRDLLAGAEHSQQQRNHNFDRGRRPVDRRLGSSRNGVGQSSGKFLDDQPRPRRQTISTPAATHQQRDVKEALLLECAWEVANKGSLFFSVFFSALEDARTGAPAVYDTRVAR